MSDSVDRRHVSIACRHLAVVAIDGATDEVAGMLTPDFRFHCDGHPTGRAGYLALIEANHAAHARRPPLDVVEARVCGSKVVVRLEPRCLAHFEIVDDRAKVQSFSCTSGGWVEIREVRYEADGRQLTGILAVPDGPGPRPAVLIAHEGPGLDDIQRSRAREIAELGYVGFALDYHGELSPFPSRDDMMARLGELFADPDRTRSLAEAALNVVLAEPSVVPDRVAIIGYCFGGTLALELGRTGADIKAIVGFHPGLTSVRPADSGHIRGRVLMCIGADDPHIPPEHRAAFEDEMRAAGVDWELHLYGGVVHSFTHPNASSAGIPGIAYDKRAADHAWAAMIALLSDVFG